ncbi:hypothetical protein SAMN05660909_05350 [Chitinophaga terrae (ex Kim and Jung 2007)]|uniref:Type VI secretion system baseplate subunit TssK n=2 Tax=Chitinophaga terrae (ex Kim and Jung 2007) TaxID=408074 RepID=A0A1H4GH53_9BACT|nr:hypothetical protein SAMN05660909_05350 [Chitinophaga terrae (ex Kim and Jung 2007)]
MNSISFFSTNWVDGMKIRKQHFIDSENALLDQIRDSNTLDMNGYNYGLLAIPGPEAPISCWLNADNQGEWNIKTTYCKAITPSGARIEINNGILQQLSDDRLFIELNHKPEEVIPGEVYFIIIGVQPFNRRPVGKPLLDEIPPRFPYSIPTYYLTVIHATALNEISDFQVPVARIQFNNGAPAISQDYIPPCRTLKAHPRLVAMFEYLLAILSQAELHLIGIIQKIHFKQQYHELGEAILQLSTQLIHYLNTKLGLFKNLLLDQPPVYMLEIIAGMARTFKNAIDQRAYSTREELVAYLSEWSRINAKEMETILTQCANLHYQHTDIQNSAAPAIRFAEFISRLFQNLCQLDFIGRKQEANIFVKEESHDDASYLSKHRIRSPFFTD